MFISSPRGGYHRARDCVYVGALGIIQRVLGACDITLSKTLLTPAVRVKLRIEDPLAQSRTCE